MLTRRVALLRSSLSSSVVQRCTFASRGLVPELRRMNPSSVQRGLHTSAFSSRNLHPSPHAIGSGLLATARHQRQSLFPLSAARVTAPQRTMFIQTESTPNPNSLKFIPGKPVLAPEHGVVTASFPDFRTAQKTSPLAAKLFSVEGVTTVLFGRDYIAVNISEDADWLDTKPAIFGVIMDFYASGDPVMREGTQEDDMDRAGTRILDTDDEATALIKELLESRIRPAVQEDGGDVVFKKFDEDTGIVWLQLQGSCVGCPSSSGTLKHGIQNMLTHYVEEVKGVEEWVDEELESVSQEQLEKLEQKLAEMKEKTAEGGSAKQSSKE